MIKNFQMREVIESLWRYERHTISDGYDHALKELKGFMDMEILEIPSGQSCGTWVVPQKWTCHEAYIENLAGKKILDIKDSRIYCAAYSQSFEGVLTREELLTHVFSDHPVSTNDMTDGIPFIWKFYYRQGWGLLCSRQTREELIESHYRVCVRTEFVPGTLKIAEHTLPGETGDLFLICAHLCHAFMVQDGLSAVAVGMDVMRRLSHRHKRRYTYKLIIAPETIGGICWLDRHRDWISRVRGGVYLDMLGLPYPHALQHSFLKSSEVDRCFSVAFAEKDPDSWSDDFRKVVGNDERQYSGPGVRIPMVGLSRSLPRGHKFFPYREYHTNLDTPATIAAGSMEASSDLLLAAIDLLENNYYPVNRFFGEVFLSGAGIDVDWYRDHMEHAHVTDTMHLMDGVHSILDIIEETGFSSDVILGVVDRFCRKDLVILSENPIDNALWSLSPRDLPAALRKK